MCRSECSDARILSSVEWTASKHFTAAVLSSGGHSRSGSDGGAWTASAVGGESGDATALWLTLHPHGREQLTGFRNQTRNSRSRLRSHSLVCQKWCDRSIRSLELCVVVPERVTESASAGNAPRVCEHEGSLIEHRIASRDRV
jgi:hypothetical protein